MDEWNIKGFLYNSVISYTEGVCDFHPEIVEQIKNGKYGAVNSLFGMVMKKFGKLPPDLAQQLKGFIFGYIGLGDDKYDEYKDFF